MRTLNDITRAARTGAPVTELELRSAVAAYDVLIAQMDLGTHYPEGLKPFFQAATIPPVEYIGWGNHWDNPDFVQWYTARDTKHLEIVDGVRKLMKEGEA